MKPNYLVIGAAKCASSSLCHFIGKHPDAFMCTPKEPFFFSHDRNYVGKGWSWYEGLFAGGEGRRAVGEGSVTYSQQAVFPKAAPRIARDLPEVRLIYITRHPLEQIESLWMMLRSFWRIHWEEGLRVGPDFNRSVREDAHILLDTARYWTQINRYRDHFPDERILVLFFDDFKRDPDAVLRRCYRFLEIDSGVTIEGTRTPVNVSREHFYDRPFFKPLRLLPGASQARQMVPENIKGMLRPLLRKPDTGRPQWDPDTRRWVVERLADETRTLLTRYGKPADFWDLSL